MLSGLYYPFSRTIESASLKQMLLVFDSLTFLDPVEDDSWRAFLYSEMETTEDKRFSKYRNLRDVYTTLIYENAIRKVSPKEIKLINHDSTTISAVSDLLDVDWTRMASNPKKYKMPHRNLAKDKSATWQIFKDKLPDLFIETVKENKLLNRHLVYEGGKRYSWTLSYEAGSAISMNAHLAAAEELGLAPVTDSEMHNQLLIQKSIRDEYGNSGENEPITKGTAENLARTTAIELLKNVIPKESLQTVSFDDILKFREDTKKIRQLLIQDLETEFKVLSTRPSVRSLLHQKEIITKNKLDSLKEYENEMSYHRNKIFGTFPKIVNTSLVPGGLSAVVLNFLGTSPGYLISASVLAGALGLIKTSLDIKNERRKLKSSVAPTVSFLSTVKDKFN